MPSLQKIMEYLNPVAELDSALSENQPELFLKTSAYKAILSDTGVLIIGRKGGGKTAIRLGLEYFGGIDRDLWINIRLGQLKPASLESVLARAVEAVPSGQQTMLDNLWRLTVGVAMMRASLNHGLINARAPKLRERITKYLGPLGLLPDGRDNSVLTPDVVLARILDKRRVPEDQEARNVFPMDVECSEIERSVVAALEQGNGAVVTLDDLDPTLEKYKDVLVPAAESLIRTSGQLGREYADSGPVRRPLRIKCFVPKDMFSGMQERHWDKLAVTATTVRWTFAELRNLVARRFNPSRAVQLADSDVRLENSWIHAVLGTRMGGYFQNEQHDPFAFIAFHSQFRPRDIIFFLRDIIRHTLDEDKDAERVDQAKLLFHVMKATQAYCKAVIDEYVGRWPNLARDVMAIQGLPAQMPATQLRNKWRAIAGSQRDSEWPDCLHGLYEAGVIGYLSTIFVGGQNVPQEAAFSFSVPEGHVTDASTIVVHPLFWSSFGVTPVRYKMLKP